MPPPSPCCPKYNTRSTNDQCNENDSDDDNCGCERNTKPCLRHETLGLVKTILGPSLEGAVLRTLEFGKSLIQGSNDYALNAKDSANFTFKDGLPKNFNLHVLKGAKGFNLDGLKDKKDIEYLFSRKKKGERVNFLKQPKEEKSHPRPNAGVKKPGNLSKIRSLDSDLKKSSPSPEAIKKQLEALIQINKGDSAKKTWEFLAKKIPNSSRIGPPVEMTVMSGLCMYNKEADMNCSSCSDILSQHSRNDNNYVSSKVQGKANLKKRCTSKIAQAPEFLSNALGPTLDVSIIDNLKLMRNILKNDKGMGEGPGNGEPEASVKQEIQLKSGKSEVEMCCRIEELQKHIEELERKEQCLRKQIEEEELQRACKKKAFEEEERKLCEKKAYIDALGDAKRKCSGKSLMACNLDAKYENVLSKIACEEEKLAKLKCQYENYKRELAGAKHKKESLKRNKTLLDAWDVFASRVCHTRLPSFSRASNLERKQFNSGDSANFHCCLQPMNSLECPLVYKEDKRSGNLNESTSQCSKEHIPYESQMNFRCKMKMGEIQFPIQRDITCGLHQMLKSCDCISKMRMEGQTCSNEDIWHRNRQTSKKSCYGNMGAESSAQINIRNACGDKNPCRSKSDTSVKAQKCSKIVKVMWAVTRINVFQNNYRTYEILEATATPPPCVPNRTEGIFVVKSQRRPCFSPTRKKCPSEVRAD